MKTYILYTTSKSKKVEEQAEVFAKNISQTKGRGDVTVEVKQVKAPRNIELYTSGDNYILISWQWFQSYFPKGDYDGVIFHFSSYYRKKWGIKSGKPGKTVGGYKNTWNKEYPEFWVCDDLEDDFAEGYEDKYTLVDAHPITDFLRKLFHEHAHFDEDLDDTVANILTQDSVHKVDYELKQIQYYHLLVDYRGKAIKEQVDKLIKAVIKLARKIL